MISVVIVYTQAAFEFFEALRNYLLVLHGFCKDFKKPVFFS